MSSIKIAANEKACALGRKELNVACVFANVFAISRNKVVGELTVAHVGVQITNYN
jgi:ribosomal protein S24E